MSAARALLAAVAAAAALAASPSRTSPATATSSPSAATRTPTPSQTPSSSPFPVLVPEDTWAVIDTSNTSTTGAALIPTTGLLFRDVSTGGLYLQLQAVTPCNATANPAFGGCPVGTAADLVNAWVSGGAYDSSYGYYPNVASEGTTFPDGTGNLPLNVRHAAAASVRVNRATLIPGAHSRRAWCENPRSRSLHPAQPSAGQFRRIT